MVRSRAFAGGAAARCARVRGGRSDTTRAPSSGDQLAGPSGGTHGVHRRLRRSPHPAAGIFDGCKRPGAGSKRSSGLRLGHAQGSAVSGVRAAGRRNRLGPSTGYAQGREVRRRDLCDPWRRDNKPRVTARGRSVGGPLDPITRCSTECFSQCSTRRTSSYGVRHSTRWRFRKASAPSLRCWWRSLRWRGRTFCKNGAPWFLWSTPGQRSGRWFTPISAARKLLTKAAEAW